MRPCNAREGTRTHTHARTHAGARCEEFECRCLRYAGALLWRERAERSMLAAGRGHRAATSRGEGAPHRTPRWVTAGCVGLTAGHIRTQRDIPGHSGSYAGNSEKCHPP